MAPRAMGCFDENISNMLFFFMIFMLFMVAGFTMKVMKDMKDMKILILGCGAPHHGMCIENRCIGPAIAAVA